ncbi:prepilin peptidase [Actinoplanes sp. NEAU-A12]|uniref:Prepilin peptidase n=1 Tax=Actinoplanes sandaracinus TaxID=3045177 RepID=A0ABT6WXA0_9ACTN|nr:prepilin peptidase [Actinoplanes sandaracinus]MDI6104363.1 prepilin peptidase [Actinoplanes sandaracinus]
MGALAGIPVAAIAYATPAQGSLRVPERWWFGTPARPTAVATVSLLTGTVAGLVTGRIEPSAALPAFWLFAVLGVCLAVIDLRRRRLPHAITGTLVAACILCFTADASLGGDPGSLLRALATGSITAVALLTVALALPGQLGLGDVALAGAVTLSLGWLSWHAAATGIVGAFLLQGAAALAIRTGTRKDGIMPMGPALVTGWLVAVLLAAA